MKKFLVILALGFVLVTNFYAETDAKDYDDEPLK